MEDYYLALKRKFFPHITLIGCLLGTILWFTLAGCEHNPEPAAGGSIYVVSEVPAATGLAEPDDYVYYPRYQMYYGSRSQRYCYQENGVWVAAPGPRGLTASTLQTAPSVRVNFHDSPVLHHPQILGAYPPNWLPPGEKPVR